MGYTRLEENTQSFPLESRQNLNLKSYDDYREGMYAAPPGQPPAGGPELYRYNGQLPAAKVWAMNKLRSFILAFDIVFHATPIMFIALALISARLDGKDVSQYGEHLQQVLLISPTIFPVIFAALMGRCFKYLGLYLAERGTTLGRLEQLIGSQSLFSALERQVSLRGFSLVGYVLTLLWLLSPLGGQSALRLQGQVRHSVEATSEVQYLNPDSVTDTSMLGASGINSARSLFTPIFLAALLSSSKYQDTPMDLWGNVKLPNYRSIENTSSTEWKHVPIDNTTDTVYASLIGIPVAQLNDTGTSNFSIKARQWDISCDKNEMQGGKQANFGRMDYSTWKLAYTPVNTTCKDWPCTISFKSLANETAQDSDFFNYTVASCTLRYDLYEAHIGCRGRSCAPREMRRLDPFTTVNYTQDADVFMRSIPAQNVMGTLPTVDNMGIGSVAFHGSSNAEKWMRDPTNFVGMRTYVQLYALPPEVFSQRLTILWNTFFQSTYATETLGGNLARTFSNITASADAVLFNSTAAATTQPQPNVWRTNWMWFAVLLVAAIILQMASFVGLFLKYYTCVPDVIGYASSMTLLNPYVPGPTGGTTLHGLERAHMLQHMRVMVGDVCPNEPVGAVAFAKADDARVARLNRKRFYV